MLLKMIIGVFYLFLGSVIGCDIMAIMSCTMRFVNQIGIRPESTQMRDEIEQICPILENSLFCYENASAMSKGSCDVLELIKDVFKNSIQYICETGKEDILRYEDCWDKEDVVISILQFSADLQYTRSTVGLSEICDVMDKAKHCFYTTVYDVCGNDPAAAIRMIINAMVIPVRRYLNCGNADKNAISMTERDRWCNRPRTTTSSHFLSFLTILIAAIHTSTDQTIRKSCDSMSLRNCFLLFEDLRKTSDSATLNFISNTERRHQMCLVYPAYSSCLNSDTTLCQMDLEQELKYGTIERMLNYACGAGKSGMDRNNECWTRSEIENGIRQCELDSVSTLRNAADSDVTDNSKKICNYVETLEKCVKRILLPCSIDAQNSMTNVLEQGFSKLLENAKCSPQDTYGLSPDYTYSREGPKTEL